MRIDEFDYELPEELIAQEPLADRASSRLLYLNKATGAISHLGFRDCVGLLESGDLLVMNDTRVTARRLMGKKETGAEVELLVLRRESGGGYWCLARPGRRLKEGARVVFEGGRAGIVRGIDEQGLRLVEFDEAEIGWVESAGETPLPPYITTHLEDEERYQTVYASAPGSAAAPTAGLHFTDDVLEALKAKGVGTAKVTLDVSLDTFRPMSVDNIEDHVMHGEVCRVSEETAALVNGAKGRIVAVGTTSVRTLESFCTKIKLISAGEMNSKLFIRPGYEFRVVDGMFTNFHMPKTTMLLMIAAMAGASSVRQAYLEAVKSQYRFLSFGDSMLIL